MFSVFDFFDKEVFNSGIRAMVHLACRWSEAVYDNYVLLKCSGGVNEDCRCCDVKELMKLPVEGVKTWRKFNCYWRNDFVKIIWCVVAMKVVWCEVWLEEEKIASSSSSTLEISHLLLTVFREDCYEHWSSRMRNFFRSQKLWKIVEEDISKESLKEKRIGEWCYSLVFNTISCWWYYTSPDCEVWHS